MAHSTEQTAHLTRAHRTPLRPKGAYALQQTAHSNIAHEYLLFSPRRTSSSKGSSFAGSKCGPSSVDDLRVRREVLSSEETPTSPANPTARSCPTRARRPRLRGELGDAAGWSPELLMIIANLRAGRGECGDGAARRRRGERVEKRWGWRSPQVAGGHRERKKVSQWVWRSSTAMAHQTRTQDRRRLQPSPPPARNLSTHARAVPDRRR